MQRSLFIVGFFIILVKSSQPNEAFSDVKLTTIELYHSLSPDGDYRLRNALTLPISNAQEVTVKNELLSVDDLAALKKASLNNELYFLKAVAHKNNDKSTKMAYSFTTACSLLGSSLSDTVTISLDYYGNLISVSDTPHDLSCSTIHDFSKPTFFNTTAKIVLTSLGPVPDTQSYIQRMEQEKMEKMRGEKGDNRSFLAKYWMYIIPLVLLLLISGTSSPEGQ